MAGETPGGGTVQASGGEGVKAQFRGAGMDIIGNSLQAGEILDFIQGVAGFLQQRDVGDDAVGFIAVADSNGVAVRVLQVEVRGGHFVHQVGAVQLQRIIRPGSHAFGVADLEQGGSGIFLFHFSGQGVAVGAGSGGQHFHFHAGLLGIELG